MTSVGLAIAALVLMEPLTAALHRVVFHGPGMSWHRSHHAPPRRALEANDLYPVTFGAATIALLAVGVGVGGAATLVPIGVGITLYGAAYLLVHDVVIHRRLPWPSIPDRVGTRLRAAHNVHHLYSGPPFGFLVPVVPRRLATQARAAGVDRTERRAAVSGR